MKWVNIILVLVMIILYGGNAPFLHWLYPLNYTDHIQNELSYVLRNKIYEVLFCLGFVTGMLNTKGVAKALFSFAFMVSFASCIDKIVLDITQYLRSDGLIVVIAGAISIYIYKRDAHVGKS